MRFSPAVRVALSAAALLAPMFFAAPSLAQDSGEPTTVAEAEQQLQQGEKALAASGGTCVTMCKALQSMIRAADRICELAKGGTSEDEKRCSDARAKVSEAIARVRSTCPDCNPAPPLSPATKPVPPPPAGGADTSKAPAKESGETTLEYEAAPVSYRAESTRRRQLSITLDVAQLVATPFVAHVRFERAIGTRFAVVLAGGLGSLPSYGPGAGKDRLAVTMLGLELRGYVVGRFDGTGLFVGAEVMNRSVASFLADAHLTTRGFPLGITVGPTVGLKTVTWYGLTLEARVGAAYVVDDNRTNDEPRDRIVPTFGGALGWTF